MALDKDDLYACYRRMEAPLYNVLYRWLWQAHECQDIMHEAYLRVWARRERVDPATLDRLIWTTALNLARNRLRWRKLWQFSESRPVPTDPDDPEELAARRQRDRRLREALANLPRGMRQVLMLSEFGGLGVAEIAAILGIPPGTVGSRKHQALRRLRIQLKENDT